MSRPNLIDDDLRIYYFIQIDNILLDIGIAYQLSEHLKSQTRASREENGK